MRCKNYVQLDEVGQWLGHRMMRVPIHLSIGTHCGAIEAESDNGTIFTGVDAWVALLWATQEFHREAKKLSRIVNRREVEKYLAEQTGLPLAR